MRPDSFALSVLVALAAACSRPDPTAALQAQAAVVVRAYQPALDALVARIAAVKHQLRSDRPGWEMMLRNAEAANDELGLPPFTQATPPGPQWRASPASLLGMGPYVLVRAQQLARRGSRGELAFLVDDAQRRYREGVAEVDRRLAEVEHWLAPSGGHQD